MLTSNYQVDNISRTAIAATASTTKQALLQFCGTRHIDSQYLHQSVPWKMEETVTDYYSTQE